MSRIQRELLTTQVPTRSDQAHRPPQPSSQLRHYQSPDTQFDLSIQVLQD